MGCISLRTLTFPLSQSIWNFRIMQHAMKTLSEKLFPRSCLFYVQNQKLFQSRMEAACWDSVKLLARRCNSCWRTKSWIFYESSLSAPQSPTLILFLFVSLHTWVQFATRKWLGHRDFVTLYWRYVCFSILKMFSLKYLLNVWIIMPYP